MLPISRGDRNCPFFTFTGFRVRPQASTRSVCRQRKAGTWSTSSTSAAGSTSEPAPRWAFRGGGLGLGGGSLKEGGPPPPPRPPREPLGQHEGVSLVLDG